MLYFCLFLIVLVVSLIIRLAIRERHIGEMESFIDTQREALKFHIDRYNQCVSVLCKKDCAPLLTDNKG